MSPDNQKPITKNRTSSRRLKVLISAYACEPGKGSEPGVGWNAATEMAKYHDVWVLTRANNREVIEAELQKHPVYGLHFLYFDLPKWSRWWKKGGRGVQLYYSLWQRFCWRTVRKAYIKHHFDLTHHVTFGKYWVPSVLAKLPVPFVWGTVGGGESMPRTFAKDLNLKEMLFEVMRSVARWMGEHNPAVIRTASRSAVALAATKETESRLRSLGCKHVQVVPQCALTDSEIDKLASLPSPPADCFRFISMGRPLPWKGFYLGIKAFAEADLPQQVEYWIIANGVGRSRLEELTAELGLSSRVRFFNRLPALEDVYQTLSQCHALVHPALHEAFGNVVLEAMSTGRPALTLDIGGPALQVLEGGGLMASSVSPSRAVSELAEQMRKIHNDSSLYSRLSKEAVHIVSKNMTWLTRVDDFLKAYESALVTSDENHPGS